MRITIKGTPPNRAPAVATEIPDQTATLSMAFSYQVPAATFTDADGDTLTYTATLADDTALPSWLSFSAATRTFSGTPTDAGTFSVKVTASDASESVSDTFDIVVGLPPDTSPTLVSNAGQRDDAAWSSGADRSQAFTTSASATLSSVEIISEDQHSDDAAVSLCTVDGSNHPTSDCTPLTAPSSFAPRNPCLPRSRQYDARCQHDLLAGGRVSRRPRPDTGRYPLRRRGRRRRHGLEYRQYL